MQTLIAVRLRGDIMFFKKNSQRDNLNTPKPIPASKEGFIKEMKDRIHTSADFKIKELFPGISLLFFDTLVDSSVLNQDILSVINEPKASPDEVIKKINIANKEIMEDFDHAIDSLLKGSVVIHCNGYPELVSANIKSANGRSLTKPENESQVLGPQIAYNESLDTNIALVRSYLANPNLCNESLEIGVQTRTRVSILYIRGIADEEMLKTLRQRIGDIKIDGILDSSILLQLIEDNSMSIFPQMMMTERPDRTCSWLLDGKLVLMVDGSVQAVGCPLSFIEFFQSMEDQNVRWHISTFLRFLRLLAMIVSIFFTALYVASLTFHYEIIPQALLVPLSESRSKVPFPPIFEALLLEFTIELLREAGARLPTKVGQTMGIVGGIVVGTAAVEAGFTSNILIIIIALSALASFTTPSYMMGNVIRVLRFPLIFLAGFWGFYGLMFGFCFLLIHLLKQSSLGSPFLAPFYPPRFRDWRDSIIRLPFSFTNNRPVLTRPKNTRKFFPKNNE
jgi:hypothetical protein